MLRTASPCLFIVLAACGINPGFDGPTTTAADTGPAYLPDDQSYVRIDGQACNMPSWTDIHDFDPIPKGGWCIAADVTP